MSEETSAPRARIQTKLGPIEVELFAEDAPGHVENFLKLAREGFYKGSIFHRVIDGFVIQGGCPEGTGRGGPGYTIKGEFNDRIHDAGILSMARKKDPDSAGSQFFICLGRLPNLDNNYTVFGHVVDGMDVVKRIGKMPTGPGDRPLDPIAMEGVEVLGEGDDEEAGS